MCDENTIDGVLYMLLTMLKGRNTFTTSNTRSSMKGFYSSFVILYYVVLAKNVKMDPRIITFQILELYF